MKIIPAIMSGGAGTRLWPLSTSERPKQFHRILSDRPMIVETARRFTSDFDGLTVLPPIVIAGASHKDVVQAQFEEAGISPSAIILEPMGRNTAAAAAVAALVAQRQSPGAMVLLLPADHLIKDLESFKSAIQLASEVVGQSIVTFGMSPTGPETGFGYIQQGPAIRDGVFQISSFKEKPDHATAERYLASGDYSWNSGIFFYSPDVLLAEFETHEPDMLELVRQSLDLGDRVGAEVHLDDRAFAQIEGRPVDIAIMEKTEKGAVVPCAIDWADVGSWAEYWRLSAKDGSGNATEGSVLLEDVENALVRSEDGMHVSVCGVSDVIVIATRDNVLVLPRSHAQRVKDLIPRG